jgi:hypothetical protein
MPAAKRLQHVACRGERCLALYRRPPEARRNCDGSGCPGAGRRGPVTASITGYRIAALTSAPPATVRDTEVKKYKGDDDCGAKPGDFEVEAFRLDGALAGVSTRGLWYRCL